MDRRGTFRYAAIAVVLGLGLWWSLASARSGRAEPSYPRGEYLASVEWLKAHKSDKDVVIVDVREDKYFDERLIPGAIRLPWGYFRYNDTALGMGGLFVGPERAQEILGSHGITRSDLIVLYDSVESDGGATASYVFWVLDLIGHEKIKVLEGGLDAWTEAGGEVVSDQRELEPAFYQALREEVRLKRWVDGHFISCRLGDSHYQVLDVRSREEYLGEKPDLDLEGAILKLGHIPTSVNIDYRLNWRNSKTKALKPYGELQELYRGLDPSKGVIAYCHSGRRGSFTYFVLRLMGFEDTRLYDRSWFEWGNEKYFFPVERRENILTGGALPEARAKRAQTGVSQKEVVREQPNGGYVSCGG